MKINNCCWFADNVHGAWPGEERDLLELPLTLRRRLTPLGRKALQTVSRCGDDLIPWIISCRHGDISRRLNLLSNLAQGEMLSPADFSLSVHNAIIGMYTIATGNKHMHSALAGGPYSFEMGLLESIAFLKEQGGKVGYCYYDHTEDKDQMVCLAMILGQEDGEITIEYKERDQWKNFNILEFLDFLKNDAQRYRISVGGGEILFTRT